MRDYLRYIGRQSPISYEEILPLEDMRDISV
jgi:hypothetical protein